MFPYNKKIASWGSNYDFIDLILSRTKKRPLNFLQNTAAARLTEVAEREKMHVRAVEKMKMEEVNRLYVKEVMAPHALIKGDDDQTNSFCLTSYEEFYKMGAAVSEARNNNLRGKPAFQYSVRVIDENFDYVQTRRDSILSNLLKKD